ncbi:hypothetical protein THRCLA_22230 [Thraustotheca clavata]|uniref:Uncharacterized protein n=1 Tax=Thraustotheca clavata TaxID=74557 RepID=A0A1V9Z975_9STRA|nr:hypothetical protein THRCLA_22230 [Thraustotheca clavata]
MHCGGCGKSHDQVNLLCSNCTMGSIQQKRTMLLALRADVAVLHEKAASVLKDGEQYDENDNAEEEAYQQAQLEKLNSSLDIDRIKLAKMLHTIGKRRDLLAATRARLEQESLSKDDTMEYIINGLHRVSQWNEQNLKAVRRAKVIQLLQMLKIIPAEASPHFRTIAYLPLPISGRFEGIPPEVIAAALGRLIHVLRRLQKYLSPFVYPYPMVFNGSVSTIGHDASGEGAGCHTLYPDGSLGFERGTQMLMHNILYLCVSQGMSLGDLHPTDMLGNLILLSEHPGLGSCRANHDDLTALRELQEPSSQGEDTTLTRHLLPQYATTQPTSSMMTTSMLEWNVVDAITAKP